MHTCIYGSILVIILTISIFVFLLNFRRRGRINAHGKSVLVTGCDSGFGFHIAKQLERVGFQVFAGCLDVNGNGARELKSFSKRIQTIQLDVTKDSDVSEATQYIEDCVESKGLWGIINNAGLAVYAECEWCSVETYQRLTDVNLIGLIRVTKAFLPLVRKSKGRVVNVASLAGRSGFPGLSAYSATKFGVIGFSESLRREMVKFNVKVITVEPALYKTPISDVSLNIRLAESMWEKCSASIKDHYGESHFQNVLKSLRKQLAKASPNITPVLDAIEDAICCLHPNSRYVPELCNSVMSDIFSMLPYSFQDKAVLATL